MEAAAMFRGGFPCHAPASSGVSPASSPPVCFFLRNPSDRGFVCFSTGKIWVNNPVRRFKFSTQCAGGPPDRAQRSLKSLLSLVPKLATSEIVSFKNEALKSMILGRQSECDGVESQLRSLCAQPIGKKGTAETYDAVMAGVEILIHLEKYEDAWKLISKLDSLFPPDSDARPSLYKAIVHTMLGNHDEAKKWWNSYVETIGMIF